MTIMTKRDDMSLITNFTLLSKTERFITELVQNYAQFHPVTVSLANSTLHIMLYNPA